MEKHLKFYYSKLLLASRPLLEAELSNEERAVVIQKFANDMMASLSNAEKCKHDNIDAN